jgi:hypothetical protein
MKWRTGGAFVRMSKMLKTLSSKCNCAYKESAIEWEIKDSIHFTQEWPSSGELALNFRIQ